MSLIHEKSPKHCSEKQAILKYEKLKKKLFFYVPTLFLSILSLILLVSFILHPRNPNFSLKEANIINNHLNSSIHITLTLTLLSTNPNKKVGIYYHGFLLHASHNGHVVTPHTSSIPSFYQDHEETKLLNASLPLVDPSLPPATGEVMLDLKVTGRLRWKLGNWVSRKYRFNVDCATVLAFGPNVSTPLGSKQATVCSTSI